MRHGSEGRVRRISEMFSLLNRIEAHLRLDFSEHPNAISFLAGWEAAKAKGFEDGEVPEETLKLFLMAYVVLERILCFDKIVEYFRGYGFALDFSVSWRCEKERLAKEKEAGADFDKAVMTKLLEQAKLFLKVMDLNEKMKLVLKIHESYRHFFMNDFWRPALGIMTDLRRVPFSSIKVEALTSSLDALFKRYDEIYKSCFGEEEKFVDDEADALPFKKHRGAGAGAGAHVVASLTHS